MQKILFLLAVSWTLPCSTSFGRAVLEDPGVAQGQDAQQTLKNEWIVLHYPTAREFEAKLFFARATQHLENLEKSWGSPIKHLGPFKIHLIDRAYGNAYVTFTSHSGQDYMFQVYNLAAAHFGSLDFILSNDSETAFDTFTHEIIHHIQSKLSRMPWEKLTGPVYERGGLMTGSALTEGWAVLHESQDQPLKGRAKDSYFGALLRSALNGRKIVSGDFHPKNPEWSFEGSHYILGGEFLRFLDQKYGRTKVNQLMIRSTEYNARSDFKTTFGKSFQELLHDWNNDLSNKKPAQPSPSSQLLWSQNASDISSPMRLSDGNFLFVARYKTKTSEWVLLNSEGRPIKSWPFKEFFGSIKRQQPHSALEAHEWTSPKSVIYLGTHEKTDFDQVPSLYALDLNSGDRRHLGNFPQMRSFTTLPQSEEILILQQFSFPDRASTFVLQRWKWSNIAAQFALVDQEASWTDFESVASLSLSPDQKTVYFSGFKTGRSWDVYSWTRNSTTSPTQITHGPAVDTFAQTVEQPKTNAAHVAYLSDANGSSFQIWKDGCAQTEEPWMIQNFRLIDAQSAVIVSRWQKHWEIRKAQLSCRSSKTLEIPSDKNLEAAHREAISAAQTSKPYIASSWSLLIPQTRALWLNLYDGDWVGTAELAGQTPYQSLAWQFVAERSLNNAPTGLSFSDQNLYRLSIEASPIYPWTFGIDLGRGPSPYDPEVEYNDYLQYRAEFEYGIHDLQIKMAGRKAHQLSSGESQRESVFYWNWRMGESQSSSLAVGPSKGWFTRLESRLSVEPDTLATGSQFRAGVYLPFTLDPTHSLAITTGTRIYPYATLLGGGSYDSTSEALDAETTYIVGMSGTPSAENDFPSLSSLEFSAPMNYAGQIFSATVLSYSLPLRWFDFYSMHNFDNAGWGISHENSALRVSLIYSKHSLSDELAETALLPYRATSSSSMRLNIQTSGEITIQEYVPNLYYSLSAKRLLGVSWTGTPDSSDPNWTDWSFFTALGLSWYL